ncbi:MAG TPA: 4'-phosphopantetheinyl transferase superfamily protein, partial [Micromonosporaceae bacterium]|nr:4'-phosphopantetheinyl transferase superfamily protein [Micromonosporaceae bacterium]
ARMRRLRFAADRRCFAVAHGLLRTALSRCVPDVPPRAWRFRVGRYGRPEIGGPAAGAGVRFNLSHTAGLAAVVVAREMDCGVDVETAGRTVDVLRVARGVLAPEELTELLAVAPAGRRSGFLRYWTLKEAYAKARGLGMRLPFDRIRFDLRDGIRLSVDAGLGDTGTGWQFAQWSPLDGAVLALALRRGAGPDRRVVLHDLIGHDGGVAPAPPAQPAPWWGWAS